MEAASTSGGRDAVRGRDLTGAVLLVVAVAQVLPGLLAFLAPGVFYSEFAPYPPENSHILRDAGSWQIALGLVALVGALRTSWRVPVLAILTLQYALHSISHLIDVNESDPAWNGPVVLALQVFGTVVLGALFMRERARTAG